MSSTAIFDHVEILYRQILSLSLKQEAALEAGKYEDLPLLASEQMALLARAEALFRAIGEEADRSEPAFQEGIQRLAGVLAEVVASEERCKRYAPPARPEDPPRPARVLAAYGRR